MAKSTSLVLFGGRTEYPVEARQPSTSPRYDVPDVANVVYIEIEDQAYEPMLDLFEQWFANYEEIEIVDHGTTDKLEEHFIVVEWFESEIDRLFLDILKAEPKVIQYTVYSREVD